MIGIADDLYSFLANHSGRRFYSDDVEPLKRILVRYNIPATQNDLWLIDYARICLENIDGTLTADERTAYRAADNDERERLLTNAHTRACTEFMKQHKAVIEAARNAFHGGPVRQKYDWLAGYHNDTVERFFGQTAHALQIAL